jgi:hypothetical protein
MLVPSFSAISRIFLNGKDNWTNLFPGILEKMDFSPLRLTSGGIKSHGETVTSPDTMTMQCRATH